MGHILQVIRLGYPTGLPEDIAEMTFSWETTSDPTSDDAAAIHTFTQDAWDFEGTSGHSLGEYVSEYVDRSRCDALYFDVDTATGTMAALLPIGVPLTVAPALEGIPLPLEVAVCLSFQAVVPDVPVRNRRGRVYFGPLQNQIREDSGHLPHPGVNLTTTLYDFAVQLVTASVTSVSPHVNWSVWSRVQHELYTISGGWIDNEWDTQRRRGARATDRTYWAADL